MTSRRSIALVLCLLLGLTVQVAAQHDHSHGGGPFATAKQKGTTYMGVDQLTTTHEFEELADGGRIRLAGNPADSAATATIRNRTLQLAAALRAGDFDTPLLTHNEHVPGADLLASRHDRITYDFSEVPGGGEIRITTADPMARIAVRGFLAFQREEHQASHSH
jgi:hypothetical protein